MPILYPRRPGPESQGSNVMKKLINSPETVVTEALAGVAAAHPSLSVDVENKVITRAGGPTPGKVGLVSGGGSGHEPLHAGSSASACSTRPARARCSPRRCRTR